ncbi:hypothetical protein [Corynebacterium urealyticum]|uniref:hypothetical protein n=1 Tax=Corynebacterium urealyticum TaxID=43771 RepID=UPI0002B3F608|nr:hypothetical protein [Corynebacterium urealyticum]AGE35642.1 hypothetical protein CU7111_0040 [Corynebacterium urealyticum DSM 7111]QQB07514.1 hypothetical protein I6H53_09700 [Corynebacterium urealyticum]
MTRDKFSQNLPDDPDTLKVLFYSYADQLGDPLNKSEQAHCVLKAISEKIVRQTGLVKFRGSSEILSDEHLRQIGLVISQAAAAEHAAGQIVAVSESGPFDPPIDKAWTRSGTQLQEALKPHVPEPLLERLKTAIDLRNEIAHGFQSETTDTETYELLGLPVDTIQFDDRITIKRNPKKGADDFKVLTWRGDSLKELHKELVAIEGELEKILWEKINALL